MNDIVVSLSDIVCIKCNTPINIKGESLEIGNESGKKIVCHSCRKQYDVFTFPAFYFNNNCFSCSNNIEFENEASCFFHSQKKAEKYCAACGRFICALCAVEIDSRNLCPVCFNSNKQAGNLIQLQESNFLFDRIALDIAVIGLLLFFFSLVTAPIALFIAIKYWKKTGGGRPLPRSKIRLVLAIVISLLEICGWIGVLIVAFIPKLIK